MKKIKVITLIFALALLVSFSVNATGLSTEFSNYEIEEVECFTGSKETREPPTLRGIEIEGRIVMILSPRALTCGWTRRATCGSNCKRLAADDAFKTGINVIIYALTH